MRGSDDCLVLTSRRRRVRLSYQMLLRFLYYNRSEMETNIQAPCIEWSSEKWKCSGTSRSDRNPRFLMHKVPQTWDESDRTRTGLLVRSARPKLWYNRCKTEIFSHNRQTFTHRDSWFCTRFFEPQSSQLITKIDGSEPCWPGGPTRTDFTRTWPRSVNGEQESSCTGARKAALLQHATWTYNTAPPSGLCQEQLTEPHRTDPACGIRLGRLGALGG